MTYSQYVLPKLAPYNGQFVLVNGRFSWLLFWLSSFTVKLLSLDENDLTITPSSTPCPAPQLIYPHPLTPLNFSPLLSSFFLFYSLFPSSPFPSSVIKHLRSLILVSPLISPHSPLSSRFHFVLSFSTSIYSPIPLLIITVSCCLLILCSMFEFPSLCSHLNSPHSTTFIHRSSSLPSTTRISLFPLHPLAFPPSPLPHQS